MSETRYRVVSSLLVVAGLAAAVYLTVLHVKVHTDPSYHSVCAISSGVNCETVAESSYSIFLGVPVSVWGILGYLAMALSIAWSMFQDDLAPFGAMFLLTLLSSLTSVILGYISVTRVSSLCIFCCFTYLVNFLLLGLTMWFLRGKLKKALVQLFRTVHRHALITGGLILAGGVFVVTLISCYPHYWESGGITLQAVKEGSAQDVTQSKDGVGASGKPLGDRASRESTVIQKLTSGVDEKGHPWYGAAHPDVIIHEYSDYQCPFCARFHAMARGLVERYRGRIRLVHHNFPLDQACNPMIDRPFHPDACRRARLSLCALEKGQFWKASDWLFSHRKDTFTSDDFADAIGLDARWLKKCMKSEEVNKKLMDDIQSGISMRLEGTPTYVVNGRKYWFQELEKALPALLAENQAAGHGKRRTAVQK